MPKKTEGLSGWLVMGNTPTDNVPLWLFATQAEAVAFAKKVRFSGVEFAARHVLNVDVSDCCAVVVVGFTGGAPFPMRVVLKDVPD